MKNQYFGDINDYRKLGLLRGLADGGELRLAVCWMLTEDDDRADGRLVDYLNENPSRLREFDPELFDTLRHLVHVEKRRDVLVAEELDLLPAARYYPELLHDHREHRKQYFALFHAGLANCDLIFFDPDNGMEIPSLPKGRRGSSKHLYWDELTLAFARGHSLLVYQHFPRVKKEEFVRSMAAEMIARTQALEVYAFRTAQVVFFLIPQVAHQRRLRELSMRIAERWKNDMRVSRHSLLSEGL